MNFLTRAVDVALDRTVIGGYSRIGSSIRSRFWAPDPSAFTDPVDIVVTGGSSGIGAAAASALARLGARVHLVGRAADRLEKSAATIRADVPGADVLVSQCDVSDLDSVRALVARLTADLTRVHALIHCAGVMPPTRTLSAQGHEAAFATHVLGPVALTAGIRHLFDADSRVVFVSSGGMYPVPLSTTDFEFTEGRYSGLTAYARTKRMQVVITEQLAQHFSRVDDPVVHSMHPGWAATPGVTESIPAFGSVMKPILRTPHVGADTIVWLAASTEATATTGRFWHDRAPRPTHYPSWRTDSAEARDALWTRVIDTVTI